MSSLVNLFKCDTLQNLVQKDKQKTEKKQKEFPTELTISLQYLPPCDETITGKLVIGVEVLFFDLYINSKWKSSYESLMNRLL